MPKDESVDKDTYEEDESVQMDVLLEEWERYLEEFMESFNLIPRDFYGALDEQVLNNVIHGASFIGGAKGAIEHEYPDIKDVYAEQLYVKYSIALYNFFQKMGLRRKDPRAEIGQNDQYFWEKYMRRATKLAVENVWDLFDYEVALVFSNPFSLSFAKVEKRIKPTYSVVKDGAYYNFINNPLVAKADRLVSKVNDGGFDHMGHGFIAIFVKGDEIVKRMMAGYGDIVSNTACVGIHDWNTGAGTVQYVKEDTSMSISSAYVDDPNIGIMLHRAHRRAHHERKKVV